MMISDMFLLLIETLVIVVVLIIYSIKRKNYLTAAWVLPELWLAIYYFLVVFYHDTVGSVEIHIAFLRTGTIFSGICLILFLFNGLINQAINNFLKRLGR